MDKLRSAIADKILEVYSSGDSDVKAKLDQINRFRDFTDACQALIEKYPTVEAELLRMIYKNDFDTKVASIRVDTIIRLSDNTVGEVASKTKAEYNQTLVAADDNSAEESFEDIGYKEMQSSDAKQYVDFEEIADHTGEGVPVECHTTDTEAEEIDSRQPHHEPIIIDKLKNTQINQAKDNAKKGIQVIIVVSVIVVLIFAIVFVIQNLETVLLGLGVLVILAFTVWIILFNKKKKTEDEEEV